MHLEDGLYECFFRRSEKSMKKILVDFCVKLTKPATLHDRHGIQLSLHWRRSQDISLAFLFSFLFITEDIDSIPYSGLEKLQIFYQGDFVVFFRFGKIKSKCSFPVAGT